jgi:hypothetical protein
VGSSYVVGVFGGVGKDGGRFTSCHKKFVSHSFCCRDPW